MSSRERLESIQRQRGEQDKGRRGKRQSR
eukprot:SAG31_NODE_41089_length_277_cov_2.000000_2_plen_28_part_01